MNKKRIVLISALLIAALAGVFYLRSQQNPLIPLEVILGNPTIAGLKISPDGEHIGFVAPRDGVLNIWVRDRDGSNVRPITNDRRQGIHSFFWHQNGQEMFYTQDMDGDENDRLYSVNIRTGEVRNLTPFDRIKVAGTAYCKKHPDRMLVFMNKENPANFDAYELTIPSGDLKLVAKGKPEITDWGTNDDLEIKVAERSNEDGSADVCYWDAKSQKLGDVIFHQKYGNATTGGILFVSARNTLYALDSTETDTQALVEIDLATKKRTIISHDEHYNVTGTWFIDGIDHPIAVSYEADYPRVEVLDPEFATMIAAMKETAPTPGEFLIRSISNDLRYVIFITAADIQAGHTYLLDRHTNKTTFLAATRPALENYKLCPMKPISYTSRDGLHIEGYLTMPLKAQTPVPMIVNVHGGPFGPRDTWGYSAEVQWMANRGYAVLQVNYRGSGGYGTKFIEAAIKQYGGKMQDDVTDGVLWAIDQGIADPKKVAIWGMSYGGFAALWGITFMPDLYAAAVDGFGPSDIIFNLKNKPAWWLGGMTFFKKFVGDVEADYKLLSSQSPLGRVQCIKTPLLIAQGANDPRVIQAHADRIVEAMRKCGIEVEYLLYKDEGHGFVRPENRLDFYKHAEKFLAKYLGGRYEA